MMRRFVLFLMVLGVFFGGAVNSGAVEIFYPADGSYINHANYLIIKGGSPQLEALVIAFNGLRSAPIAVGAPAYRKVFKDILIIPTPPFEKAKNEIVVEGYVGGKLVRSAHATIYYQPDYTEPAPEGFESFVMHFAKKELKCQGCHIMDVDEAQMSIADASENPCMPCHRSMIKQKYVHGPVGSYSCGDCHTLSTDGMKYPVVKSGAGLCNECHDDKTAEFKQNNYVHGPVAAGICETCHDPHGSSHPKQLIAPVNEVCLGCHVDALKQGHVTRGPTGEMHPVSGVKDPSRPGKELNCVSCHNPHGEAGRFFLVGGAMSSFELCSTCHEK